MGAGQAGIVVEGPTRSDAVRAHHEEALRREGILELLDAARDEAGEFRSLTDFCTRIDLRLAKKFDVRGVKLQAQFDIFNILNANNVLSVVETFGGSHGGESR